MDTFVQLFEHVPELRIIVCRPCAVAIPPAHITRHLKERHPKVPLAERKDVAAAALTLPNLAWEPIDVRIPKPANERVSYLTYQEGGLICTVNRCWYTCTALWCMQEHCKERHGWVNQQKRGDASPTHLLHPP